MKKQIIIEKDLKMAQELVERLEATNKILTVLKFKLEKEIEEKDEDSNKMQVRNTLYELGEMIIDVSSKYMRNHALLYRFKQTFISFKSQYDSLKKLILIIQRDIEDDNTNIQKYKYERQNINVIITNMKMDTNSLISNLQNEFIYKIYSRKFNNYIKRNGKNMKLNI